MKLEAKPMSKAPAMHQALKVPQNSVVATVDINNRLKPMAPMATSSVLRKPKTKADNLKSFTNNPLARNN